MDLISWLPICNHVICQKVKNNFKIPEARIDTSQYRAFIKCNYFSLVKNANIILELCFEMPITKDIFQFITINMQVVSIIPNYLTRRARAY